MFGEVTRLPRPEPKLTLVEQLDAAALKVLNKYNPLSVAYDREYAGLIYGTPDGVGATPAVPGGFCGGGPCSSNPLAALQYVPKDAIILADYDTHGEYNPLKPNISYEYFSEPDVDAINEMQNASYPNYLGGCLGTPGGAAYFYEAGGPLNISNYTVERIKQIQIYIGPIAN